MKYPFIHLCCWLLWSGSLYATEYRSRDSGDWSEVSIWEVYDGYWQNASSVPGSGDVVYIRNGHDVSIVADHAAAGAIDVASQGSLSLLGTNRTLTIYNSWAGADLRVWGLFHDHAGSGFGVDFLGGGSWLLGPDATFIKSNSSSAIVYKNAYEGGMQQIPATANWVIQYMGVGSPSFSTIDAYYPNLSFSSSAGAWNPALGFSRFQGSSGTAVVYGSLSVGAGVTLYNQNTYAEPIEVQGDLYVAAGGTLTNVGQGTGTGFAVDGSIQIDGSLVLNGGGSGGLLVARGTYLGGNGSISLYDLDVQTSSVLSLGHTIWVEHNLNIWSGLVELNTYDLRVDGELWGYSSSRYVQTNDSGSLILPGSGSLYYPVGNEQYQPLLLNFSGYQQARLRVLPGVREQGSSGNWVWDEVVLASWQLAGEPGAFDVTAQWTVSQEAPTFNRTQCYLSYYQSGWLGDSPTAAAGSGPYLQSRDGLSGAGVLAVYSSNALPARWGHFAATRAGERVHLDWTTLQEQDTRSFYVEHSPDGRQFTKLAEEEAAGESTHERHYHFDHHNTQAGYYRIRLVDVDGRFSFSDWRYVAAAPLAELQPAVLVFPNPAQDFIVIELPLPLASESLWAIDAQGQQTRLLMQGMSPLKADIGSLSPGVYTLWVPGTGAVGSFVKR